VFDHCAFPRLHFLSVTKFGAKHCSPAELWPKTEIQYGGRCRLEFTFSCPFGHVIPVNVMFCICKSNYQILWKSDFRMIRRLKVAVQISCQSLCDFFVSLAWQCVTTSFCGYDPKKIRVVVETPCKRHTLGWKRVVWAVSRAGREPEEKGKDKTTRKKSQKCNTSHVWEETLVIDIVTKLACS